MLSVITLISLFDADSSALSGKRDKGEAFGNKGRIVGGLGGFEGAAGHHMKRPDLLRIRAFTDTLIRD